MSIGLLGQKIGMTSVYDANGRLRPVTVIAAGDNVLVRRITAERDGYSGVQVGFGAQKESRLNSSEIGAFKKAGVEPKRFSREFRLETDLPEGEVNLNVTQFQAGDFVDVIGRSKGKGFQGVMKKHTCMGRVRPTVPRHTGGTVPLAIVLLLAGSGKTWACPGISETNG